MRSLLMPYAFPVDDNVCADRGSGRPFYDYELAISLSAPSLHLSKLSTHGAPLEGGNEGIYGADNKYANCEYRNDGVVVASEPGETASHFHRKWSHL